MQAVYIHTSVRAYSHVNPGGIHTFMSVCHTYITYTCLYIMHTAFQRLRRRFRGLTRDFDPRVDVQCTNEYICTYVTTLSIQSYITLHTCIHMVGTSFTRRPKESVALFTVFL